MQLDTAKYAVFPICVFSNLFLYDTMATQTMYVMIPYNGEGLA
jgi:hypothetical protein